MKIAFSHLQKSQTPASNQLRISLAVKVALLLFVLIMTVTLTTNYILYNFSYQALKEEIKCKLVMIASNATVALDVEKLKSIKTKADEDSPAYRELQKKLQEIQKASRGQLRYVYTVAKAGKSCIYILDSTPVNDRDHSPTGSRFPITDFPDAINGFKFPTADKEPLPDTEFNTISQSGYAPIKDRSGRVMGMLGVDMDVSVLKQEEKKMIAAATYALASSLLFAIILGVFFSHYFTKPITTLTIGTKRVAAGDFETPINVNRHDELGELAAAFNVMTAELRNSRETLRRYNGELEDKVKQRTLELSKINKEIKDILDNIGEAIFTIDRNLVINPQYSKYALFIFGERSFAGGNILDLIFPNGGEDRDNLNDWLDQVFNNPCIDWEDLELLQPVLEVTADVKNNKGETIPKHIEINFRLITNVLAPGLREEVVKVMVIVKDITEKKALKKEIEAKRQEYKDNINQIIEVIKVDKELFTDFINDCRENLVEFEPKLIRLKEERENKALIDDLFRIMHNIKGNARFFKLERIAGEAHQIENIFSSIQKAQGVMTEELLNETFKKLDYFTKLFNETLALYNRIVQEKQSNSGKTSDERQLKESETIRVKVEQLNHLEELIKKADQMVLTDLGEITAETAIVPENMTAIAAVIQETETQLRTLRKVSLAKLVVRFPRLVHDIAAGLGKKVKFISTGEDITVDKNIFDKLADPLLHIIRNSVDHGIEFPGERSLLDKPQEGIITLNCSFKEGLLQLEIMDDGKGLDIERIKDKAVRKGLITSEQASEMTDHETAQLVFAPGFSTNDSLTEISGRGVGMDVVKNSIENGLQGNISIESSVNTGFKITLSIPV